MNHHVTKSHDIASGLYCIAQLCLVVGVGRSEVKLCNRTRAIRPQCLAVYTGMRSAYGSARERVNECACAGVRHSANHARTNEMGGATHSRATLQLPSSDQLVLWP